METNNRLYLPKSFLIIDKILKIKSTQRNHLNHHNPESDNLRDNIRIVASAPKECRFCTVSEKKRAAIFVTK